MDFEAPGIDSLPIDGELGDAGLVGPELAHLSRIYVQSPRALIWRAPSNEWRLFVVLLPLASRLSLIGNPIFAQLARAWGLNIRFIGIDRDQLVYDFRALLSDRSLRLLIDALALSLGPDLQPTSGSQPPPGSASPNTGSGGPAAAPPDTASTPPEGRSSGTSHQALDVLFATLASDLLTVLDRRREDWGRHLLREHRLEPGGVDAHSSLRPPGHSLFDRASRYPDFTAKLREALRDELIDAHFYGRALRSIDERETAIERQLARLIEANLDAHTLSLLTRTPVGLHLGCYNWLRLDDRHAASRAYALTRLPQFASFFAEALLTIETMRPPDPEDETPADAHAVVPTLDLRGLAARTDTAHSLYWGQALKRAIDAGQDRTIIEALAQRFAVGDNVIRRLWREQPAALGTPPAWQLAQILRQLNQLPERGWPADDAAWRELMARSVPAEAG